ncbi:TetR/AcrR family transcriptional regulator [Actinocorallia populi]|uniref:TetR/AcrR family transcriptional regulator n=1 Tax=Actinocorallia populi TaxID=2079200 RepID=UPI000D08BBB8|nr:TetR/AcrR family transcriptional regulator [Actinocorallia populi]
MPRSASTSPGARVPLSRERVLHGALAVADARGLAALTIRSLAEELGVRPMSVYHYVANKDEILDGIIDLVFDEIAVPSIDGHWRTEMHRRASSIRLVLGRHPWAVGLMESRTVSGPARLRHHNASLGVLRRAGFSPAMAAHAYTLLDSYVYGFVLQEASFPYEAPQKAADVAEPMARQISPEEYPYLLEFVTEHILRPDYDFGAEFGFGLDLVLDALTRSAALEHRAREGTEE